MKEQILLSIPIKDFKKIVEETIESKITKIVEKSNFEKLLSTEEVTKLLGITRVTLYSWRKKGLIRCYKIENRIYFKWSEIIEHLEEAR